MSRSKQILRKFIIQPIDEFLHVEAAGGILLLAATVIALVWANSPWAETYEHFWETPLKIGLGNLMVSKPFHFWINDGLMAVFFFVIGLEIKREVVAGELSSPKQCLFPILGAVGGMLVPALIYMAFNPSMPNLRGWGVPMATDIAFAVGVMALLGNRIPLSLKIFLTALAIVDDLGAVLVIALFYTAQISWPSLLAGFFLLAILVAMNRAGVRNPLAYAALGIGGVWMAFLLSGVHATVASVLVAFTIPVRTKMDAGTFANEGHALLDTFKDDSHLAGSSILLSHDQQSALNALEKIGDDAKSPLQHLEGAFHPWVSFVIMPLFALANAGVSLGGNITSNLMEPVSLGIIFGLLCGKPLGIFLFGWLGVKIKWASLPKSVTWKHIFGAGLLAGIGFTMSIFIATLAFEGTTLLPVAKLGILTGSLLAGIVGALFMAGVSSDQFKKRIEDGDK